MTTTKNKVYHWIISGVELIFDVGGIKIWLGKSIGGIFPGGWMSKHSTSGGTPPIPTQVGKPCWVSPSHAI